MQKVTANDGTPIILDNSQADHIKGYRLKIKDGRIVARRGKERKSLAQLLYKTDLRSLRFKNGNQCDLREENVEVLQKVQSRYHYVVFNKKKGMWSVIFHRNQFFGRYYNEDEAGIVADYVNRMVLKKNKNINFPQMSVDELEQKKNQIITRYGQSTMERISLLHQGKLQDKRNKTSNYVGVYKSNREDRRKKWVAEIRKEKKRICIGYFYEEIEAAYAYNLFALALYGPNANVNPIGSNLVDMLDQEGIEKKVKEKLKSMDIGS